VIAARKTHIPMTSRRESFLSGISPAGEAGRHECSTLASFFELSFMNKQRESRGWAVFSSGNEIM
jgi:hypothetical protein